MGRPRVRESASNPPFAKGAPFLRQGRQDGAAEKAHKLGLVPTPDEAKPGSGRIDGKAASSRRTPKTQKPQNLAKTAKLCATQTGTRLGESRWAGQAPPLRRRGLHAQNTSMGHPQGRFRRTWQGRPSSALQEGTAANARGRVTHPSQKALPSYVRAGRMGQPRRRFRRAGPFVPQGKRERIWRMVRRACSAILGVISAA